MHGITLRSTLTSTLPRVLARTCLRTQRLEAACRLVKGNNISICSERFWRRSNLLRITAPARRRRPPPLSFRLRFVPHYPQTRKSKTGLAAPRLHFLPRMTAPHHSLPALSIIPLFVLIEYLLAYLFLITDSRPPACPARARLVRSHC